MAVVDYRLNPFLNVMDVKKITSESHQIPTQSPYTIRLVEVPQKSDPSSVTVKFVDGTVLTEVAAQPSQGQYWPDYNTTAHGVTDWNTGTLLFNSADAASRYLITAPGLLSMTGFRICLRFPSQARRSVSEI